MIKGNIPYPILLIQASFYPNENMALFKVFDA